jgi:hypothetical protein
MATYQIHRLKNHLRQQFRFAPHVSGVSNVKARDYEMGGTVDAASPYAAFFAKREQPDALEVGDLLECDGMLRILKFVGFEEAQWVVPEVKPPMGSAIDVEASSAAIQ